jgi:putative flippase GtrA
MKVLGFAVVGGVGFLVDGGILTLLSLVAHTNMYLARGASFSLATLATWLLNRTFVFQAEPWFGRRRGIEYAKYLTVQIAGALVNLGVFAALIATDARLQVLPILPLAIGAAFGMVVNFCGARYWVFRPAESRL